MRLIHSLSIKKVNEHHIHHFVKRDIGPLYKLLQENGNSIVFEYSNATRLPDNYMDVKVFCLFRDQKQECWYDLSH